MHSLLLVLLLAQASQPPAPSATRAGGEQPGHSSAIQNTGNPSPSPTPSSTPTASPVLTPTPDNRGNQETSEDWRIVWFTGILTAVAVAQWIAMLRQSKHMREGLIETRVATEAAKRSADIADRSIVVLNRPWLSAELRVTRDLSFENEGGHGSLGVEIMLHNSGNTPALNARVGQYLVVDYMDSAEIIRRQEALCGRFFSVSIELGTSGDVIFPGNSFRVDNMAWVDKSVIDAAIETNLKEGYGGRISPSLITCIHYRSSLDGKVHHTRYFSRVGPRSEFGMTWPLEPAGIHKDTQLWSWLSGQYAD